MEYRIMARIEIIRLREIDRSEIVQRLFSLREGNLELHKEFHDVHQDWWIKYEVEPISDKLYVSATPSENTILFYLSFGCKLASEVDPELFALEPEDIHLELVL